MVAFACHETEQYLDRLREALTEAEEAATRLRLYVRYQLAEGERFHMGRGPQLYAPARTRGMATRQHAVAAEDALRSTSRPATRRGPFHLSRTSTPRCR